MNISPLGWVAITVIVVVTFIMNYGMIALLRNRENLNKIRPRPNTSANSMRKFAEVLRDPFKQERSQLEELSHLVETFKETPPAAADTAEEDR